MRKHKHPRLSDILNGISTFRAILTAAWFAGVAYLFFFFLRYPVLLIMLVVALFFIGGALVDHLFFHPKECLYPQA